MPAGGGRLSAAGSRPWALCRENVGGTRPIRGSGGCLGLTRPPIGRRLAIGAMPTFIRRCMRYESPSRVNHPAMPDGPLGAGRDHFGRHHSRNTEKEA